ncbi:MAG: hypothetical protein U0930_04115, partial [Pirellulales bacterium]
MIIATIERADGAANGTNSWLFQVNPAQNILRRNACPEPAPQVPPPGSPQWVHVYVKVPGTGPLPFSTYETDWLMSPVKQTDNGPGSCKKYQEEEVPPVEKFENENISAHWVVPYTQAITFNPFATVDYSTISNPALTITLPDNSVVIIGQTVQLKYGTVKVNADLTLTYTPNADLPSRTGDRLIPERDSSGNIIRFTGLESFEAHIVNADNLVGTSSDNIKRASTPVNLMVSNHLPSLPGQQLHSSQMSLDGPVFADLDETYRIDIRDLLKDIDGDNTVTIDGFLDPANTSGNGAALSEISFHIGNKVIGTITNQYFLKVKKLSNYEFEISNPLTPSDVQHSGWSAVNSGSELLASIQLNSNQKIRYKKLNEENKPVWDFKNYTWNLQVPIRVNNSNNTSDLWRNNSGVPALETRNYISTLKTSVVTSGTPKGLSQTAISSSTAGASQMVGSADVDMLTGQFTIRHGIQLDRSGGNSELALPGLIYDSSTVYVDGKSSPVIVGTINQHELSGTIQSISAKLKWYTDGLNLGSEVVTDAIDVPTSNGSSSSFSIRPNVPSNFVWKTGIYAWKLDTTITVSESGNTQTLELTSSGETPVVVLNDSQFGRGWSLENVPRFELDKRANNKTADDRLMLIFPGSEPKIFDASMLSSGGELRSIQLGSNTFGSYGFRDQHEFGKLATTSDGLVYTTATGLEYYAKKQVIGDNTYYLIDRIEQPGLDFVPSTTGRRGITFNWDLSATPKIASIIASDGAEVQITPASILVNNGTQTIQNVTLDIQSLELRSITQQNALNFSVTNVNAAQTRRTFDYLHGLMTKDQVFEGNATSPLQIVEFNYATQLPPPPPPGQTASTASWKVLEEVKVHDRTTSIKPAIHNSRVASITQKQADGQALSDAIDEFTFGVNGELLRQESFIKRGTVKSSTNLTQYKYDALGNLRKVSERLPSQGPLIVDATRDSYFWYDHDIPTRTTVSSGNNNSDIPIEKNPFANDIPKYVTSDYRGNLIATLSPSGFVLNQYETKATLGSEISTQIGTLKRSTTFAQVTGKGKPEKGGQEDKVESVYTWDQYRRNVQTRDVRAGEDGTSLPADWNKQDRVDSNQYSAPGGNGGWGVSTTTSASGLVTTYTYTTDGRIEKVRTTDSLRNETLETSFTYDDRGFLDEEKLRLVDGSNLVLISTTNYDYD